MASLNKVFLLGNLTRDPDLRGLPSGQSVCELRLAVSRRFVNNGGQEVEDTCFVDVVVWGKSAANCRQFLAKGSPVLVEGRLQLDQWEDRNGGGQRSRMRVVAEQIQFLGRRREDDGGAPQGGNSYGVPQGNYGAPQGGNSYGAPRGNAPYQGGRDSYQPAGAYQGGSYRQDAAPAPRAQEAPPMPDPAAGGDAAPEDDIPF